MQHGGLVRSESLEAVLRLNNGAFSKGDDCGFFVFLFMCAQKPLHTRENTDATKRPTPESVRLFTLMVRFYYSNPSSESEGGREEERGVVGEREVVAESLTCS